MVVAANSHLICCRSTNPALRNRATTDNVAGRTGTNPRTKPASTGDTTVWLTSSSMWSQWKAPEEDGPDGGRHRTHNWSGAITRHHLTGFLVGKQRISVEQEEQRRTTIRASPGNMSGQRITRCERSRTPSNR
jgi:hypothetical protein